MTDTNLLNEKIAQAGVTKRFVAKSLNISEQSLRSKIANKQDFRQNEIIAISETLRLTVSERNRIFFA